MTASDATRQTAEDSARSSAPVWVEEERPESFGRHLRRIAIAAMMAVAPLFCGLLFFGKLRLALSVLGGGFVSLTVFACLRIMVYQVLGAVSPGEKGSPDPGAMAKFSLAGLLKFVIAALVVWGMVRLHANLMALLVGFVVAQIAIAISVSRGIKGR